MADPSSPHWTISWTLRKALRPWIKAMGEHRPDIIADQVIADLRQSNWHLVKGPSDSGWAWDDRVDVWQIQILDSLDVAAVRIARNALLTLSAKIRATRCAWR